MTDWIGCALSLVKKVEGCKLTAYPDPATGGDPWTIGYGATGPDIHEGTVWTQEQADNDLSERLREIGREIDDRVFVPLTPQQKAALASFIYNIGIGAFEKSTLLRRLNDGDYAGAAQQFARWDKAAGKVMAGLIRRRKLEAELFNDPHP